MKLLFRSPQRAQFVRDRARMILSVTRGCVDFVKERRGFKEKCTICGIPIPSLTKRMRLCYKTRSAYTACMPCFELIKSLREEMGV